MSCQNQPCLVSTCDPQSSLNFYIGLTSIQSNPTYANVSEIVVPVSYGTGYYIVAPDTIQVVVPQNATTINYQGCQSAISLPVPAGATQAQISAITQQVMQQAAQQLSQCNAPAPTNPFDAVPAPTLYSNAVKSSGCSGFPGIKVTGSLPAGITVNPSSVTVAAGIFTSSVSQEDADNQASLFLIYFIEANCQCGWWNTLQIYICPDMSVQTIPENTYFSATSQADADAQAMAAAQAACPALCPDISGMTIGNIFTENIGVNLISQSFSFSGTGFLASVGCGDNYGSGIFVINQSGTFTSLRGDCTGIVNFTSSVLNAEFTGVGAFLVINGNSYDLKPGGATSPFVFAIQPGVNTIEFSIEISDPLCFEPNGTYVNVSGSISQ